VLRALYGHQQVTRFAAPDVAPPAQAAGRPETALLGRRRPGPRPS
jgi:hypothetical protein